MFLPFSKHDLPALFKFRVKNKAFSLPKFNLLNKVDIGHLLSRFDGKYSIYFVFILMNTDFLVEFK